MRRAATPGERRLWEALRGRRCLGLKFRRQAIIGGFIVDFYCPELRVVIEIDGPVHESPEAQARDRDRDLLLAALGVRMIHLRDELATESTITNLLRELNRRPPSPYHGEGDRG